MTALHKDLGVAEIHCPISFEYADQASREGATGLTANDVRKFARQTDNNTLWFLSNHSPVAWIQVGGGGGAVSSVFSRTGAVVAQSGDYSASQVGLGNVTNDAQLKRAAGDFAAFTAKGTPVAADLLLIEDSADSDAKKKITAGGLPVAVAGVSAGYMSSTDKTNLDIVATTPFQASATASTTTTGTSDALLSGMTLTPGAGNYMAFFTGSVTHGSNDGTAVASFYVNGVKVDHSEREFRRGAAAGNNKGVLSLNAYLTGVLAGQAIEVRWRTNSGTATAYQRTFNLMKVT